jgi:uncharacterized protein (TIGR02246 family)
MTTKPEDETVVHGVLAGWKDAVERHEPKRVASHFTEDAVFQALDPYTVGRPGIVEYYDSRPYLRGVEYRILETRRLAEEILLAYLHADFSFTDRPTLGLKLGVLLRLGADGWAIAHYQVSKLD